MKTAILLSTMGGPDSLESVGPFLFRLFNDPAIIRVPQPFRFILAKMIARRREKEAQRIYSIMGGKSPIIENTLAQAAALEKALNENQSEELYRCFVGMSYARPFIESAVKEIKKFAPDRMVVLPLYPQYSTTTTASVLRDVHESEKKIGLSCPVNAIERFYANEGFIEALRASVKEEIHKAQGSGPHHILFSAHGLPEKIVRAGDPYQRECEETARLLARRLNLEKDAWTLCYQSQVGPMKWIGPDTKAVIEKLAREKRGLIVVPIAFVCEHSETLVELGHEYRRLAQREGARYFGVAATVGVKQDFIQGLAEEIRKINQN